MYEIFEHLLQKHEVTAYQVGKETGIPASTFSDWKKGKSRPKQDKLKKIADYFGISVDDLFSEEINNSNCNSVEYVRNLCSQRNIPIKTLEQECGFANGYLNPKKISKIPYDRALLISKYLHIDVKKLLSPRVSEYEMSNLDIVDLSEPIEFIMQVLEHSQEQQIYYNGTAIDETSITLLRLALAYILNPELKTTLNSSRKDQN